MEKLNDQQQTPVYDNPSKDGYVINFKQNPLASEELEALLGKPVEEEKEPQRSKRANLVPLVDETGEVVALVQEDLAPDVLEYKQKE